MSAWLTVLPWCCCRLNNEAVETASINLEACKVWIWQQPDQMRVAAAGHFDFADRARSRSLMAVMRISIRALLGTATPDTSLAHPQFLRWRGGAYSVQLVAPLASERASASAFVLAKRMLLKEATLVADRREPPGLPCKP